MVIAVAFTNERIHADTGYYLLRALNEGAPHVEHGRWTLVLPQLAPLIAAHFNAPISTLLLASSLGNVLFLIIGLVYCTRVLRNVPWAVLLAGSQVIGLAHGHFCPGFELYFGVGAGILFLATVQHDAWSVTRRCTIGLPLLALAIASHPMGALLMAGILVFTGVIKDAFIRGTVLVMFAVFVLIKLVTVSPYERTQMQFVERIPVPSNIMLLLQPDQVRVQLLRYLDHYPDAMVLLLLIIVVAIARKAHRSLGWTLAGCVVLYIATNMYLPDTTHDRYREQVDYGLMVWILFMAMHTCWAPPRSRMVLLLALVGALAYRATAMIQLAPYYQARTAWHEALIDQAHARGLRKVIVDTGNITFGTARDQVTPYWSTGVECLLLSAREGPSYAVSVITTHDRQCTGVEQGLAGYVMRCWDVFDTGYLDSRWFQVGTGIYKPLPMGALP